MFDKLQQTQVSTTISGKEFTINKLSGFKALKAWLIIQKTLGATIGTAFDKRGEMEYLVEGEVGMFETVLSRITEDMASDEYSTIIEEMLKGVIVDGKVANLDEVFTGAPEDFFELIIFAFKENFGGFFIKDGMFANLVSKAGLINDLMPSQ
ncbi:tail assembly chaperone [Pseudoalteromonas phage J2-1_QLiu-2017]|nr:tail assembly chaperone [Pseudoalteromonas phage J2-1_QLiu-2017]